MSKTKKQPDARLVKLMYRREEASFVLGLSVREIDRMISEQQLTTRRYGRCVLIPAGDVQHIADQILASDMLQASKTPKPVKKHKKGA